MTKTTNYQLNQWAKSDRVMMDDFNADNTKIRRRAQSQRRHGRGGVRRRRPLRQLQNRDLDLHRHGDLRQRKPDYADLPEKADSCYSFRLSDLTADHG